MTAGSFRILLQTPETKNSSQQQIGILRKQLPALCVLPLCSGTGKYDCGPHLAPYEAGTMKLVGRGVQGQSAAAGGSSVRELPSVQSTAFLGFISETDPRRKEPLSAYANALNNFVFFLALLLI